MPVESSCMPVELWCMPTILLMTRHEQLSPSSMIASRDGSFSRYLSRKSVLIYSLVTTGGITWTQQFDSPVVGIYSIGNDGAFMSCPFRSVALETLEHLSRNGLVGSEWADKFSLAERFKDSFLSVEFLAELQY